MAAQKHSRLRLAEWVRKQGRVTVADLCTRSGQDCKTAAKRLFKAEAEGLLIREGGGPRDAFYWRAADNG